MKDKLKEKNTDIITEKELLEDIEEGRGDHKLGKTLKAKSIEDLLKNTVIKYKL